MSIIPALLLIGFLATVSTHAMAKTPCPGAAGDCKQAAEVSPAGGDPAGIVSTAIKMDRQNTPLFDEGPKGRMKEFFTKGFIAAWDDLIARKGAQCLWLVRDLSEHCLQSAFNHFQLIGLADKPAIGRQVFERWPRTTGGKNQFYRRPTSSNIVGQLETIHRTGHLDISKNGPNVTVQFEQSYRFVGVARLVDVKAGVL
jgi:hypothetical protein